MSDFGWGLVFACAVLVVLFGVRDWLCRRDDELARARAEGDKGMCRCGMPIVVSITQDNDLCWFHDVSGEEWCWDGSGTARPVERVSR